MKEEIVYFACNDWNPTPNESYNICYNYLSSYASVDRDKVVNKTIEEVWDFVKNNKIPPSEVGIFTIKKRKFDLFEVKKSLWTGVFLIFGVRFIKNKTFSTGK
jgi:hypothetical protein